MNTKNFKYKKGGRPSSETSLSRYKKYQTAGVYGQSSLNMPPPGAGYQEQFRYQTPSNLNQQIANQQNLINEANTDYDQALQLEEAERMKNAQMAQTANTVVGTGLTAMNKGNFASNAQALAQYKGQVQQAMLKQGISKGAAVQQLASQGVTKPMARGLLGTGTASVAGSNLINVGSLVGTVGGAALERAWSDDDPTTYTFKEGVAGALKTGSSWAGYGNMILPGVGGLVGGLAGIGYSIFSGRKKAKDAEDKQKELEREHEKKVNRAKGTIRQLRHKTKQQVGAMMGNKYGGVKMYKGGGPKSTGDGPLVNEQLFPLIQAERDSTHLMNIDPRLFAQMQYYNELQNKQKMFENNAEKLRYSYPQLSHIQYPQPVIAADNTYIELPPNPPSEEKQMGGFQEAVPEEMMTMQQYQQPFQMPMSDNLPYYKGGLKRY